MDDELPSVRWTARCHASWLDVQRSLSAEEGYLLNIIADLFCLRNGRLPDDEDRFVAGHANWPVPKYRRIKEALLHRGHLTIQGGLIICHPSVKPLQEAHDLLKKRSEAGKASARKRARRQDGRRSSDDSDGSLGNWAAAVQG